MHVQECGRPLESQESSGASPAVWASVAEACFHRKLGSLLAEYARPALA